jgi:hypothetical protein
MTGNLAAGGQPREGTDVAGYSAPVFAAGVAVPG